MRNIIPTLLTAVALLFTACDNGYDCNLENTAYNRIGFYSNQDSITGKYRFPETLTVSLRVNGTDSIVVNHITDADGLQLPMSYTQSCDTVIFGYDNGITDTLYFNHENIPYYQSMECGTVMYHKIEDIAHTSNFIDSVSIEQQYVKFDANENVKIYFVE